MPATTDPLMPKFVLFLFLLFASVSLRAQTWEVGGSVGGAGYMGDLNPNNPLKISGIALGAFVQRNHDGYFATKLKYTFGHIGASDNTSSNPQFGQRNLSFSTLLNEVAVTEEFNFFKYIPEAGKNKWTPFIYLGIGAVGYNPKATYQGQTYDLRALTTEGEPKPYSKIAISIPYGAGFKYNFSGKWSLIGDIGYRNPTTDYLDDVSGVYPNRTKLPNDISRALSDRSGENTNVYIGNPGTQRGDGRPKDTYFFVNITISFTFVTSNCYY
jgi:Domain of unknown function (DUF6089)